MTKTTKTELRLKFKNIRNSINPRIRKLKSDIITDKLSFVINNDKYSTFFVYKSFSSEVETGELINSLQKLNKNILIPKCNSDDSTMKSVQYRPDDALVENIYGIEENSAEQDFKELIDVIILPGIAFDKLGGRIGFGKGYYDRFINSLKTKPLLVGICYDEQIPEENIPCNKYDITVDIIVTDKEIIKVKHE